MLNSLNNEERKIITIEDPVEYQFPGITQISVQTPEEGSQNNFAAKLRAVLRLDPDIVMVGEVRDMDTAKTALQAALTGHLVLSTFHAASAGAAISRLADIIQENPLFISAIRLIMAQRLVRKLDDSSKQPYQPDEKTVTKIAQIINSLPQNVPKPDLNNLTLYRPAPSENNPYGFRGQLAIREQFTLAGSLLTLFETNQKTLTAQEIEEAAIASGMCTMMQDGILKVISGQTTLEEVYRVIG
jgi:type II secretory ATPase GspE/PulE/Tfp pilus assembly ATPase PilB-like protein